MRQLSLIVRACLSAAILASCGGAGSAIFPSSGVQGTALQRTHVRHATSSAYQLLYSFGGYSGDGYWPSSGLTFDGGLLYGTTQYGPTSGYSIQGTVFSVSTNGIENVLYAFGGYYQFSTGGLADLNGVLYGTTAKGGTKNEGEVFSMTTGGAVTMLHSFGGTSGDGQYPQAGLVDVNGILYGTTQGGGANDSGTVFSITTGGAETVLHSFGGGSGDGFNPSGYLTNVNGVLYGTTESGGANNAGTVFSITTGGTEKVLHSFGGGSTDGANPAAGLVAVNNAMLYGTTIAGGASNLGTVFSVTTDGTEAVLHSFGGGSGDGQGPTAGLVALNGTLYGTTAGGGANGRGTVFSITTGGAETVLHSFGGSSSGDGAYPYAPLTNLNGTLYGTTTQGGAERLGSVFSLTPSTPQTMYVTNDKYENSNKHRRVGKDSVTVYAGTTGASPPSQDIEGSKTKLKTPMGIAVDFGGNVYVANEAAGSVTVYGPGATGNAAPIKTISGSKTGLAHPWGLALDPNGNIYVANNDAGSGAYSITVYAAGANGNVAPVETISGAATLLNCPTGLALDASSPPNIYVANDDCTGSGQGNYAITVFAGGANGNVAPIQTITGNYTGLGYPQGVAVDGSANIYVFNWGGTSSITVYAAGANGNVAPIQTITGPHTTLYHAGGIAVDVNGGIHVADSSAGNNFSRPPFSVPYFAPGANGDAPPTGVLKGSRTKLIAPEYIFIR